VISNAGWLQIVTVWEIADAVPVTYPGNREGM
jgi:hypothetical protein